MPAWNFFSSASSRFSASARDARVASTRLRVGLHVAREIANLRRDLQLRALQLLLRLRVLQARARQVGSRRSTLPIG